MPLLELRDSKPLAERFSFLNLTPEIQNENVESPQNVSRTDSIQPSFGTFETRTQDSTQQFDREKEFFEPSELRSICVVKTTMMSQKLFINLVTLDKDQAQKYRFAHYIFSELVMDTDKSGNQCCVLSTLLPSSTTPTAPDFDTQVQAILTDLRQTLEVEVGEKYTVPKMKKKGELGRIRIPGALPVQEMPPDRISAGHGVSRPLITELSSKEDTNSKEVSQISPISGATGVRHEISQLSRPVLATPLPTRYTHDLKVALPSEVRASTSWSVYFDSQDSTLKILLPPKEDFITIAVRTDDFRAFTKDNELHVFYVGS